MKMFYIPEGLELCDLATEIIDQDKLAYLITSIYEQNILYKNDNDFVPLKAEYLRNMLGDYQFYRDCLLNAGVVGCDWKYIKTQKSYGFKLLTPFDEMKTKCIVIQTHKMKNKIALWQRERIPNTPIHKHLFKYLMQLTIDKEANNTTLSLPRSQYNSASIAIQKLINKDFYLYKDDYGRVHTNITVLKSCFRKFLKWKDKRLVNIDISNAQPLIILFIYYTIRCKDLPKSSNDTELYRHLVENGELYDYMAEKTGVDKHEIKQKLFKETFFGKGVSKEFALHFPTIANFLKEFKKKDYKKLAWSLQREESKLIVNDVCGELYRCHPNAFISTIHDSVMTTEDNVDLVKRIILDKFKQKGLRPAVRVEY